MKILLLDEMFDGFEEDLLEHGYKSQSVKKLKADGSLLATDFSVITFAKENSMILVTEDGQNGKACLENNIPCVFIDKDAIVDIMVEKLKGMDSSQ